IRPMFNAYPNHYALDNNNIYYDVKANPIRHMVVFFPLHSSFQRLQFNAFVCFSNRQSWSPSYILISTKILWQDTLGRHRCTIQSSQACRK
ncbi:hypothetical protein BX666DRAFT_1853049, partial [Dichotomocladium elegans]